MKVYIVEYIDWEQSSISGVFDTYEKALEFVDNRSSDNSYDIYEWEVNTEFGSIM